jgi:hypothetical protein
LSNIKVILSQAVQVKDVVVPLQVVHPSILELQETQLLVETFKTELELQSVHIVDDEHYKQLEINVLHRTHCPPLKI